MRGKSTARHVVMHDGAVWLLALGTLLAAQSIRADLFHLRNGARLRGEWQNPTEAGRRMYRILTESGIEICVAGSQVVEHVREPAAAADYLQLAPTYGDTVADQRRLADWCRAQGLKREHHEHLRRIIELDPSQSAAWQALGYTEINGQWVTKKEFFEGRGFVYYRGKWRLPQEVDVMEERRRVETLEREWFARLKTWRGQLGTASDGEGARQIVGIRDPLAVPALADLLQRERSTRVRLLCVNALAEIRAPRAVELLVSTALQDRDPEVFHACVERLVRMQIPGLSKTLVNTLKDSNNTRVNRAAHILGRLGDRQVIPSLVAALVTTHYIANPAQGRMTATLVHAPTGSAPGGAAAAPDAGISGGRGPSHLPYQVANQEVLQALVALSGGQSFGFEPRAWNNWWSIVSAASRP